MRFELHAEVPRFAGTRYVCRSPASSMTVLSVQGAVGSAVVLARWRMCCCVCGEDVGVLGVVEVIVVKRSGVGCCEDFWKAFVVIRVRVVESW